MILIKEENPRKLIIGNEEISGGDNRVGLYAHISKLYFDGIVISESSLDSTGIRTEENSMYFNGMLVASEIPVPTKYWNPPVQASNVAGRDWTYAQIIQKYDALCALDSKLTKHRYEDNNGDPILSTNGGYEQFHYVFEPDNYDKTFFMSVCIHGNEKDSRLQVYRIFEILIKERNNAGYTRFQELYNRARIIVIPVVSPWGNDNNSMNVPYEGSQYGLNMNRTYDYVHQYGIPGTGVGGNAPFECTEVQHVRDAIVKYGAENIDYAFDHHDGGGVPEHYWINYNVDSPTKFLVMDFVNHLIEKHNILDPVIPNCKNTHITGSTHSYYFNTLGLSGSVVEWIGGLLGYDFSSNHLTQSLEIRANMLFIALDNDVKEWKIREKPDAAFFEWDYPVAFTRDSLRLEGAATETKVTDEMIYKRWDDLVEQYPNKLTKSETLGVNATGRSVHTYTFGQGQKKVMYVGGVMRYGGTHKIDEYAIYQVIAYLCNDYVVNQSKFLTDLRDNYTIIVLPFIDNTANNTSPNTGAGLNNTTLSRQRWIISGSGKTIPATGVHGADNYGVQIIKNLIDSNANLKCIVSGGEIMSGFSLNPADYSENYQAQFVITKNMANTISDYTNYLRETRGELIDLVNTKGFTFGDYAYDTYSIPVYFVQQKVSSKFTELSDFHDLSEQQYLHGNYEVGRRISNIINLFIK